ncbi:MAG: hypothetical protein AAB416_03375 [Patescibacteria group bacterium]
MERQEESPVPTTLRLKCAENREYTKALLLLGSVGIAVLVVTKQWTILAGLAVGIVALGILGGLWRRWQHNDPIRRMDRNLPRISFEEEA